MESQLIDFSKDPEFSDVTPVYMDERVRGIVDIKYSEDFLLSFPYFRALFQANELSFRALRVTEAAISANPSNYTVWTYRRRIIFHLGSNLLNDELIYVSKVINDNLKNYQAWHHRKMIVEKMGDYSNELNFTEIILMKDSKNYHAWQHRHWAVEKLNIWNEELKFINFMIESDVLNNSAWHHRYQSILNTSGFTNEIIKNESEFVLENIKKCIFNVSAWNYLEGIIPKGRFNEFIFIYEQVQNLMNFEHDNDTEKNNLLSPKFTLIYDFMVHFNKHLIDENYGDIDYIKNIISEHCSLLADNFDTIRRGYWLFIKSTL